MGCGAGKTPTTSGTGSATNVPQPKPEEVKLSSNEVLPKKEEPKKEEPKKDEPKKDEPKKEEPKKEEQKKEEQKKEEEKKKEGKEPKTEEPKKEEPKPIEKTKVVYDPPKEGEKAQIIFVMGGPGSGKGTQCVELTSQFKIYHLSTGDLLRDEVKRGTAQGVEIEKIQKEGKFVSSKVVVDLIKASVNKLNKNKGEVFLLDGFPRNQENVDEWEKQMKGWVDEKFMIVFDCPEEVLIARCTGRKEGRADDNPETIKKRIANFVKGPK